MRVDEEQLFVDVLGVLAMARMGCDHEEHWWLSESQLAQHILGRSDRKARRLVRQVLNRLERRDFATSKQENGQWLWTLNEGWQVL